LIYFIFYFLAIVSPYIRHKKTPQSIKNSFQYSSYFSKEEGKERVRPLLDNQEAFEMHLRLIANAKKKIAVSTYRLVLDRAGKTYLAALLEAADRGVQIDFITDGKNKLFDLHRSRWFQTFSDHKNINVYIYNPVSILRPHRLLAVHHSKYLLVDDSFYVLGGRNICNRSYLNEGKKNKDCELLVYSPKSEQKGSVEELWHYHNQLKALPTTKPYRPKGLYFKIRPIDSLIKEYKEAEKRYYPKAYNSFYAWKKETVPTHKISLLTSEIKAKNKAPVLWDNIDQFVKRAERVKIYTPYIICGKEMYEDLTNWSTHLEKIEILTNSANTAANVFGASDYLNQKHNILDTGVLLREMTGGDSLHQKAYLLDENLTILGSVNMDMRSVYIDTELMIAVDSVQLNQWINADFEHYCSKENINFSNPNLEEEIPQKIPFLKRMLYLILRIINPFLRRFC